MSSDIAISVEGLSKCYPIYNRPIDRLKQFIIPKVQLLLGRPPKMFFKEFWALRDVSFEVSQGETVGIIGRNGSGKSTLLQIICGTLNQTKGDVRTVGRVGALLELGSGFNPEFTGRENVHMNAAVLGLSKDEIDACYDDIVRFADIGDFIDQPVKTYSSGMMVRLAFAVQAQIAPKILIVDEALAVGDAKFQAKCFERLRKLKESGTSILLVTHSAEQVVSHCSKALLLEAGQVVKMGAPKDVVNTYMDLLFGNGSPQAEPSGISTVGLDRVAPENPSESPSLRADRDVFHTRPGYNPYEFRWGDGAAKIMDFLLTANDRPYPTALKNGAGVSLLVTIKFFADVFRPIFGFALKTKEGVTVYGANSETLDITEIKESGRDGETLKLRIDFDCRLASGDYFVSLGVASKKDDGVVPHDRRYDSIHLQVEPNASFFGLTDIALRVQVEDRVKPAVC